MKRKEAWSLPSPIAPQLSSTKNFVAKCTNRTTLRNSQIFETGTNVGIGTANPTDKFEVRGNVKLGSHGEFFGPGGIENLLLVRGMVNLDGTSFGARFFGYEGRG